MQRYSSGLQADMSSIARNTWAIKEPEETMETYTKENADLSSSNEMDIALGTLPLRGNLHYDMKGDAISVKLSQLFQEVTIERTNKATPDTKLVNDHSEGCARGTVDILKVAGQKNGSIAKERGNRSNSENKDFRSTKPSKLPTLQAQKGQTLAPRATSAKCTVPAMTQIRNMHEETENRKPLAKVSQSKNNVNNLASKCSNTAISSSPKCTIAKPFALATDKRAEERPPATVLSCPSDFPQDVKNLRQKFFVAKSNHSDNVKPSDSQDLKVQTNATGFNFRSDERAKKRKEFYSKLQEKSNAKEEEKAQMQAKTEKENEEALKVLRRSLTFKASPMPSFYQEGPAPKFELKKMPTTQAKSPKFSMRGRRAGTESLSNAASEVDFSQRNEHPQHMYGSDVLLKSKDCTTEMLAKCSLLTSPGEQNLDSNFLPPSRNEGADAANKENHEENCGGIERMNNNQKPKEGTRAKQLVKGAVIKASSERHQSNYSSNVLKNCVNKGSTMPSAMPNNMKPKVQPLPFDMKEDVSPMTSKTTKKERLKALTPYFRKRESIGNGRKSTTALLAQEDAGVFIADFKVGT